jgi:hypothetical protein
MGCNLPARLIEGRGQVAEEAVEMDGRSRYMQ